MQAIHCFVRDLGKYWKYSDFNSSLCLLNATQEGTGLIKSYNFEDNTEKGYISLLIIKNYFFNIMKMCARKSSILKLKQSGKEKNEHLTGSHNFCY